MASSPLPTAFAHLADERNAATDAALVEALPHLDGVAQVAGLDLLMQRGDGAGRVTLLGRFERFDRGLQRMILAKASGLSDVLRRALSSVTLEERLGGITVIERAPLYSSAYLLSDALRSRCNRTRDAAAAALYRMTDAWMAHRESGTGTADPDESEREAEALAVALSAAIDRWEAHFQPRVIQAGFWLGRRIEPAVRRKLDSPRSKFWQLVTRILSGTSDPRLAEFMLRALAFPSVRADAARAIARAHQPAFLDALLRHGSMLADPDIAEGCRWVRDVKWLPHAAAIVVALPDDAIPGAVKLIGSVHGPMDAQTSLLRELLGAKREALRHAVVDHLLGEKSKEADDLLAIVAVRGGDELAERAAEELRERRPNASVVASSPPAAQESEAGTQIEQAFSDFWERFDSLGPAERAIAVKTLRGNVRAVGPLLRARLASSEAFDRARALRVTTELGPSEEWHPSVERLAHDSDAIVRALAVALLGRFADSAARRILRSAVNDPDSRVQATAIEALDRLDAPERVAVTVPKLKSSHSRVRANAVQSLLRANLREAGSTLLDMLDDESPAHRISALWVVERLHLQAVRERLVALSASDPDEHVRRRAKRLLTQLGASSPPAQPPATIGEDSAARRAG